MIERRSFGKSGFTLPVLGIGCWSYGGGDYWGPQDQQDVNEVVGKALDQGFNYFDTAEAYNEGRSEEALGLALKSRRREAFIGTKVLPAYTEPATLRQHCELSLKRLQTDVIDIYMVHWPILDRPVGEVFQTLASLQTEGKIKTIGVSNFGVTQLGEALESGAHIEINQLCYNLMSRAIETDLVPYCSGQSIGILAYSPLLQGLLTGKYHSVDEMPSNRTRTRHYDGNRQGSRHREVGAEVELLKALDEIRKVADGLGVPLTQLALAWVLARREITCVLPGIRTQKQLAETSLGAQLQLPEDVKTLLDHITQPLLEKLGNNSDYYQNRNESRIW